MASKEKSPPSNGENIAKLRLGQRHISHSELEDQHVIQQDGGWNIVRRGPAFDEWWDRIRRPHPSGTC